MENTKEGVTVTIGGKQPKPFEPLDIIYLPTFKNYSICFMAEDDKSGTYSLSMHRLRLSRWKIIRYFELKIFKKVLNKKK